MRKTSLENSSEAMMRLVSSTDQQICIYFTILILDFRNCVKADSLCKKQSKFIPIPIKLLQEFSNYKSIQTTSPTSISLSDRYLLRNNLANLWTNHQLYKMSYFALGWALATFISSTSLSKVIICTPLFAACLIWETCLHGFAYIIRSGDTPTLWTSCISFWKRTLY